MKPARLPPAAQDDLIALTRCYAEQGGHALGARLFDAAQVALEPLARMPGIGSPRVGQRCNQPGLRAWRVQGWPVQSLNFERDDHLDVIRLLGERQDVAAILISEPPSAT